MPMKKERRMKYCILMVQMEKFISYCMSCYSLQLVFQNYEDGSQFILWFMIAIKLIMILFFGQIA